MNVELAEERILQIVDRFTIDDAEVRAWSKRTEAFGTLAKMGSFIAKPKDDDFQVVYRERRLQPFWRLTAHTSHTYERKREHRISLAPEVRSVAHNGEPLRQVGREIVVPVTESCHEEKRGEWFYDGITKQLAPALKSYAAMESREVTPDELNAQATAPNPRATTIVVPPLARVKALTGEVLQQIIPKIDADVMLEEKIEIDAIELYYRPVYAYRYKWQNKEAVVEFDALTGEAKVGGTTFENYVGKLVDPAFLLDVGIETAGLFLPGANLAKLVVKKGLSFRKT
jgi:hypothetical protein